MKSAAVAPAKKVPIRIAVVESDPLRFVGFRALFDSEPDFELISASMPDIATLVNVDLILLGNRNGQNLFDLMASLKATRPDLRIIVTGSGMDEETILNQPNSCRLSAWSTRAQYGRRAAFSRCSSSESAPPRGAFSRQAA